MKFRLIFKQAVRDFKNKVQLYLSFTVFILISIALILGLFSFNFTFQENFDKVMDSIPTLNERVRTFQFASVNAEKVETMTERQNALNYQLENGEFTNYAYRILSLETIPLDDSDHSYRPFTPEEMVVMWNDVGYDGPNLGLNIDTYFNNNVINFIGEGWGGVESRRLAQYQNRLGLSDEDVQTIFDANGQINENIDQADNHNFLRYAAFAKLSFFARQDSRFVSPDPNSAYNQYSDGDFYDRNMGYNSNLITKYVFKTKFLNRNTTEGSATLRNNETLNYGTVPFRADRWHPVDGINGANLAEGFMPGEQWMNDEFDRNDAELVNETHGWEHIPLAAMKNNMTNLEIYDRLSVAEIKAIDPDALRTGNYVYVNPLFLESQQLKLGDKISHFSNDYQSGHVTYTIIGTAVSKGYIFEHSRNTTFWVSFFQLMKRTQTPVSVNTNYISFPSYGDDTVEANRALRTGMYDDFQDHLIPTSAVNNFQLADPNINDLNNAFVTELLYNVIAYAITGLTLLLLFVVFYFITDQSIKLQKSTLRFLKSNGENNYELSLITTLSSLMPILIGAGLGVVLSFGVSQIMISVTSITFPFYMPAFAIHPWAILVFVVVVIFIFLMFLATNWIIIRGKILNFDASTRIGWVTKIYLAIKPVFKYLQPSLRIGISFIAKNIFKNILTFILLTITFGVVLFSVQFKFSSETSAASFESRYTPYRSVFYNQQSTSDSVSLNLDYLETYFANIRDVVRNPLFQPVNVEFNKLAFYKGPLTTYKTNDETFIEASSGNPITLSPILREGNEPDSNGDIQFNTLIKNQINELVRGAKDYFSPEPSNDLTLNPEYDIKNYYFDADYTRWLLTDNQTSFEHAEVIFALTEEEVNTYANDIKDIVREIEVKYGVSIYDGTDDQLVEEARGMVATMREGAVQAFGQQLNGLRESAVSIRNIFREFDFGINLFFNRNVLPNDQRDSTTWTTNMIIQGRSVSGLGLDNRNDSFYQMIINPLPMIALNDDDFSELYTYRNPNNNEETQVPVLDVYISGNLADQLRINSGAIVPITIGSFAYDFGNTPTIYVRVVNIVRQASFLREIYFNKVDLFNYLKVSLEKEAANDSNINLNDRADYQFYRASWEALTNESQPNNRDLFNNTVFSTMNLPYGITNFAFNGKIGQAYSILAYTNLPTFNYASQNYPVTLGAGSFIFSLITERLLRTLDPIIQVLDRFIILLLLITLAVALILITLILLENRSIIVLFKSLGYRKGEVNNYITMGYVVSTILALVLGVLMAYYGILIASSILVQRLQISLFFVWSPEFILYGLGLTLGFIFMTLLSVTIYTNKQSPKNAFADL